ncbi:MAG TPA: rhodanese-like domain-containing protein [Gemmatimonadaceae bacterium]|jgi:rhodanese-related sulfurtransferase|nr:rhodanese-like domain-containing protein [Gemmatimonadaceae bacterium]
MAAHKQHSPGFLALVNDAKSRVREISVEETLKAVNGGSARLIDVREDNEWTEGHARGADHLGKGIIERDIEKTVPDKDAELILYCGGGYRAALAADNLQKMGYTNVASMAGGWRAYVEANAPVEV